LHAVGLEANTSCGRLSITSCVAAGRRQPLVARLSNSFDQFPDVRLVVMMIDCKIIVANGGGIIDFSLLCTDVVTRGAPE
jgi:hypothetical protein